ncbi:hypothetical protein AaE_002331 [Aphanomyces astaci]|uniref:Thioredoxin domain-containing protein n=1 Tax=Aphanomyces astaci TaxID=112090 RepID=A0A6A5AA77_APHAT|nr:hypothetical protein AaE_002331 [Aphanomyces astaci]
MSTKDQSSGNGSPSSSHPMTTMRIFQLTMGLLLLSTVGYIAKFTTIWTTPSLKLTVDEVQLGHMAHLSEVLETRGRNRYFVPDYDAAETFLRSVDLTEGPLFVLLMSGEDNGAYWCGDCERARKPISDALARAPSNTRLLEVSVGAPSDWKNEFNPFRTKSTFHIRKIPALLKYDGNLRTSHLLSESFATQPALLDFEFASNPHANKVLHSPTSYKTIRDANEMVAFLEAYQGDYPLFLSFTSAINEHTGGCNLFIYLFGPVIYFEVLGTYILSISRVVSIETIHHLKCRLWCPFCDIADIPIHYYFDHYAPSNAVLLTVVVADTYLAWKDKKNPFRLQTIAKISGLPTLSRAVRAAPTDAVTTREYYPFFENIDALQAFYQAPK